MPTGRNINYGQQQQQQQQTQKQAPRAEFDSMSNLSSNSSNTSISNTQQQNQKKSTNETSNIPLFQELDPLNNKKRNSPLNFKNFNVCLVFFLLTKTKIYNNFFSLKIYYV